MTGVRRTGWGRAGGVAMFALGFAVYAWTASPSIGWLDSPEFVAAGAGLGIAHSPGHPIPALLGYLATLLPVGDVVWRIALMSALLGALALVALWHAGLHVVERVAPSASPGARDAMAAATALVVGLSWAAWSSAVRAEVYALQLLLSAVLLMLLVAHDRAPGRRRLAVAGLVGGLALSNHNLMAVLLLLPAAIAVWARPRGERPTARTAAIVAGMGVLGLCALLYLPVRAATYPEPNFGNPSTAGRLLWTLSGAAFAGTAAAEQVSSPVEDAVQVVVAVGAAVTVPLFLLACFGFLAGIARQGSTWRRLALLLGGVAATSVLGRALFGFEPDTPDHHAYLTPAIAAVALLGLAGIAALVEELLAAEPPRRTAGGVAAIALALLVPVQLWSVGDRASLRRAWAADELARWELSSLPPRTLLLSAYFQTSFRASALRAVEGARPDLAILDRSFLTYPGMVDDAVHRHPELEALVRAPLRAGLPTPVEALTQVARRRPVYAQLHPNVDAALARHLVPSGAFAAFAPEAPDELRAVLAERDFAARAELAAALADPVTGEAEQVRAALLWHEVTRLDQYCARGDREAASRVAAAAGELAPDDPMLAEMIAACPAKP